MLEELRNQVSQELRIPEVRAERCVHTMIETASCRACVNSCPQQAWQLDDERLGIDMETCDGCGLCAAACRQGAILHAHEPTLRQLDEHHQLALIACEKTGLSLGEGVVQCIHALSLHDLLKLYRQGIRALLVATFECRSCTRNPSMPIQLVLHRLNQALTHRKYSTFLIRELPIDSWQTQRQTLRSPTTVEPVSRRNFLRRSFQGALKEGLKVRSLLSQDTEHFPPPGTLLPVTDPPQELPFVPQISAEHCTGCDTCFKICPNEVLLWDEPSNSYVIKAERCTGCGICVDLCAHQAITVTEWIVPNSEPIALHDQRCRHCGVTFHQPLAYSFSQPICPICRQTNHYRNLFQVLK